MTAPLHLDDIGAGLASLAARIDTGNADTFVNGVLAALPPIEQRRAARHHPARPRPPRRRRRWSIAVAAVVAAAATTLAIPDARASVADWLGIGNVHVVRVRELPALTPTTTALTATNPAGPPTNAELATSLDLRLESDLDAAGKRIGIVAQRPTLPGLAVPDLSASGPANVAPQIVQVWRASNELAPSKAVPAVAIILSQIRADIAGGAFQKLLPPNTSFTAVRVNGVTAWWITGDLHELTYFTRDGTATEPLRLAGDTLLWFDAGVTYRLESTLGRDRSIAFAESLR